MDHQRQGSSLVRTAAIAVAVLAGCYLGARFDTWLCFRERGAGMFFPPYAILAAAMLRARPRSWWIFMIAACAGGYFPHRHAGATVGFVLASEVLNDGRALLAVLGLRAFDRRARMDTVPQMAAYLALVVFLAPAVAALGSGYLLVFWRGGPETFWIAWQQRWLSNAITGLTLLPILSLDLGVFTSGRRLSRRRIAEAALLVVALCIAAGLVFARSYDRSHTHQAHLYWALPVLLWAVRFGPRGTSTALLGVAALSIWGAVEGRGPFAAHASAQNLLELQVFLLAVSVPLLLLAASVKQQRLISAALIDSRRQYRSIVEDQTEMICRFLPDGTYTFVNRAYADTFGVVPGQTGGCNLWTLVPPGIHRSPEELKVITPDAPVATREVNMGAPGGAPRWLQWRDRGFFDERGAVVEYQSVGRDVTDRKIAEDERREIAARRSAEAALRQADRRKDEFLAVLGHELRNPLAPIGIALEILRQAPPGGPDALWARESIGRQLGHMTRLLDDLLDLARVTHDKIQLQLESVEVGRVIANAVEATRPLVDSLGHLLEVQLPDWPLFVRGDAVRLTQVVANLLNNAAKYTERGGRIEVRVEREEDKVRLSVRDNGIGLDADALGRIFDLFAQIPAGRERAQGGLGIGLALVKRLVELHGGTVEACSDGPRRGSEIIVRVPAADDELPARGAPRTAADQARRPSLRILAVDDNVDLAEGLAAVLGMWGHTVRLAHDGLAALEVASTFAPEVVFVDLGLPRLSGLEVARRLRASPGPAPRLLVSMSGFGQEQTRRSSDAAGFHHHLVKPVEIDSLRTLLDGCRRDGAPGEIGLSRPSV
jgi:PAS domain S-box-containing protein